MRKIRVYGIGNEGTFNYLIVGKDKDFFKWLSKLLYNSFGIYDVSTVDYENKKGKWVTRKKRISDFTDLHETYEGNVDVFYGKKKVFIVLNTTFSRRKKFMEELSKISLWTNSRKHYAKGSRHVTSS